MWRVFALEGDLPVGGHDGRPVAQTWQNLTPPQPKRAERIGKPDSK